MSFKTSNFGVGEEIIKPINLERLVNPHIVAKDNIVADNFNQCALAHITEAPNITKIILIRRVK